MSTSGIPRSPASTEVDPDSSEDDPASAVVPVQLQVVAAAAPAADFSVRIPEGYLGKIGARFASPGTFEKSLVVLEIEAEGFFTSFNRTGQKAVVPGDRVVKVVLPSLAEVFGSGRKMLAAIQFDGHAFVRLHIEKASLTEQIAAASRLRRELARAERHSTTETQCWSHTRTQCSEKRRANRAARAANAVVVVAPSVPAAASGEPAALPGGGLVLTEAMTFAKRRRVATPQSSQQLSQESDLLTQSSGPSSLSLPLSLTDPFSGMTMVEMM